MIDNYKKQALKGLTWVGSYRGLTRIIAVVKTGILARILMPVEFGAFGIAALALSFLEISTETGINVFLIQEKESKLEEYIDTAWIISIFRGILMFLVIYFSAPIVSNFFNSDKSLYLIRLISFTALIRGFINPSVAKFLRDLSFNKDFYYRFSIFIVDTLVSVGLVYYLRSAIGMVWGLIIGAIFEVTISFIFIKPRPTFGLNKLKFKLIVKRGRWVNASLIFNYLIEQIDNGFVGKFINEGALGIYQVAYKISTLPITEVSQVVGRVTFPMITAIRDDVQRVKNVFIKTWITSVIIIAPISAVLFFYPENIVRLILGDKWMDVSIILKYLAIFGFFRSIILVPNSLFNGFKKQDWVAKSAFLEFIVLLILLYPMIKLFGVIGAIYANIISLVFTTPLVFYYFRKILY